MRRYTCPALAAVAVCVAWIFAEGGQINPASAQVPYYPSQPGKGGYPGRMNPHYPQPGSPQGGPEKLPEPMDEVEVFIYDNYFKPAKVHVTPGGTVRFVNKGRHKHTVTALTGKLDSGDIAPGKVYTFAVKVNLNHFFYCRHHPLTMNCAVVVREANKNSSRPPAPSGY